MSKGRRLGGGRSEGIFQQEIRWTSVCMGVSNDGPTLEDFQDVMAGM